MAKSRSPVYPAIGLPEAIERIRRVYEKDYTAKLPKLVIAEHMGYSALSGKALAVLSALNKYGLLEGRGDESRVTPLAVEILAHEPGTKERGDAILAAATAPELFQDMDERSSGGKGSDAGLKAWLQTIGFIPSAAEAAIRSYRETKALVESESGGYTSVPGDLERMFMQPAQPTNSPKSSTDVALSKRPSQPTGDSETPPGMRRAVFTLDEGDVEILFPDDLSSDSVVDLKAYLDIWLRKLGRDAGPKSDVQ